MTGFRATLLVEDPGGCPVAGASTLAAAPVTSVARASPSAPDAPMVEEFSVEGAAADRRDCADDIAADLGTDVSTVYADDDRQVYRFERAREADCVCEVVERSGNPVTSIRAADGALAVTVHTTDVETISAVVADLRERFEGVSLRDLVQIGEDASTDLVLVDRSRLTDRQRRVLETAHELGYFEYPKGANAGEVAAELGISRSTFAEHLSAAQSKVLDAMLES